MQNRRTDYSKRATKKWLSRPQPKSQQHLPSVPSLPLRRNPLRVIAAENGWSFDTRRGWLTVRPILQKCVCQSALVNAHSYLWLQGLQEMQCCFPVNKALTAHSYYSETARVKNTTYHFETTGRVGCWNVPRRQRSAVQFRLLHSICIFLNTFAVGRARHFP